MEMLIEEAELRNGDIFLRDNGSTEKQTIWEADFFQITTQGLEQINKLANTAGL